MLKKLINFCLKYLLYQWFRPRVDWPIETHGSQEGQWVVPKDFFSNSSTVILAGAGEDISFDISLYQRYQLVVKIVDPTPRANKNFTNVLAHLKGEENTLDDGQRAMYSVVPEISYDGIEFVPIGLWDKKGTIKFFLPRNKKNVSLSAQNIQNTKEYVELEVLTIRELMKIYSVEKIDFLKLDIEGAEYKVLDSMFNDGIFPSLLSVEFDEMSTNPFKTNWPSTFLSKLKRIRQEYDIFYVDRKLNFTFIKRNVI